MQAEQPRVDARSMDELYEQYGKPLETSCWGKFLAVTETGDVFVRDTFLDATEMARANTDAHIYVFRIGLRTVNDPTEAGRVNWNRPRHAVDRR
jgi:hypothetical protein